MLLANGTLCGFIHWFPRIILVQNWKSMARARRVYGVAISSISQSIFCLAVLGEWIFLSFRQTIVNDTLIVYIDENWRIKNKSTLQWQFSEPRQIIIILGKHLILVIGYSRCTTHLRISHSRRLVLPRCAHITTQKLRSRHNPSS